MAAAKVCKREGAKSVRVFVSHGLFVGGPLDVKDIDGIYLTDSVPPLSGQKMSVVPIAGLLAQAIERLLSAQSISSLFKQ